jgi:hypothetical protein
LGLDFGTSNTVGLLRRPDGSVSHLLFDSSPLLASAVFVGPDATMMTGADADRASLAYPAGLEPNPKRRIDDGSTWLGEREFAVVDLIAAVLAREWAEACRVTGGVPTDVVLTHPAAWGQIRLNLLAEAASRAGLPSVGFVPEPVAAAAYFATILDRNLPPGRALVVYDLGAGTFDVSVVRRSHNGFEVVAAGGLADVGGLDLDGIVVEHARTHTAQASAAWGRLAWPETSADQRARRDLWQGARAVKELLSRHSQADLHVPLVDVDLHMTRWEFEKAAQPLLDRTVDVTRAVLRSSGVSRENTSGVFLVGGSSRIPLIATLLHRALGIGPTAIDQPELVVAHGCLYAPVSRLPGAEPPPPPVPPQPSAPPLAMRPAPPPVHTAPGAGPQPPSPNGIPPRGVLPRDFPIHLVELALPGSTGYTLRTYLDNSPAVFLSEDSRLPLFDRPERAVEYAVGSETHAMTGVLHWEALSTSMADAFLVLADDSRYDLDLVPFNLAREADQWVSELVTDAADVARELVNALDIEAGVALLGEGTLLDRFDDVMRAVRYGPNRRRARKELLTFNSGQLSRTWRKLVDLLESHIDWRD